ncbi:MAG: hypothetical protein ACI4SG_06380 [Oligosphaeraceae bacterium]
MAKLTYLKYRRPTAKQSQGEAGRRHLLCRSVLEWMSRRTPAPEVVAVDVPTAMNGDKADVVGIWMGRKAQGSRKYLLPRASMAVVCALSRKECYAACVNPEGLASELLFLRSQMAALEEGIRREEPQLRDGHFLFEEYAEWNYEGSRNPKYQECLRRRREIEHMLYHGTRMERIAQAGVADFLYLAIPEGVIFVEEVMPQWGVVTVSPEGEARVARKAPEQKTRGKALEHLTLQAAVRNTLYLHAGFGLATPPRRRKA